MLRVILTRMVQVSPDYDMERQHKTLDVDLPDLEGLLRDGGPAGEWHVAGIEVREGVDRG